MQTQDSVSSYLAENYIVILGGFNGTGHYQTTEIFRSDYGTFDYGPELPLGNIKHVLRMSDLRKITHFPLSSGLPVHGCFERHPRSNDRWI